MASFEINTGKEIGEKTVIKMHKSQNLHTGPENILNLKDETEGMYILPYAFYVDGGEVSYFTRQ